MLKLVLLILLLHATLASITTTTRAHYSDTLKLKCEALPYRSVYLDANCFFVIDVNADGAAKQCSALLSGSKFTGTAPDAVWRSLFVDKSQFLREADSTSAKKAMCIHESNFKCSTGSSTAIPGTCLHRGDTKMNYQKADSFCANIGSLPSPQNDLENRIVAGASKSAVWLHPSYSKTWSDRTDFTRYGTCAAPPLSAAQDAQWCSSTVAVAANAGYWSLAGQTILLDVLCFGDAESEFWTARPKPKPKPQEGCKANHAWNDKTGRCEWTGSAEACVQLFHDNGNTEYIMIPGYPNTSTPGVDVQLNTIASLKTFEDRTPRAVVRRGCMATFWMHNTAVDVRTEMKILKSVEYGDYHLPDAHNGAIETAFSVNGLSRVSCYCDPYETVSEKPAKAECVDHHEWDNQKQRCVWKLDDNIAGEIESNEGKKLMLEIPNWPYNKRYDVNFYYATLPDFMYKVTKIIVRQGCFCTTYSGPLLSSSQPRTTVGYGMHDVASKFSKNPLAKLEQGSLRVVCECMNEDSGKERLIRNPEPPKCIDMHAYNEQTKRCEWTGPAYGCVKMSNIRNQTHVIELSNNCGKERCAGGGIQFYPTTQYNKLWDRQITYITVRRGCMATIFVALNLDVTYREYKIIEEAGYGTYRVPQKIFVDVEAGYVNQLGGNQIGCSCDLHLLALTPPPKPASCVEGHEYDQQTGICEWTGDKRICAVVYNNAGQSHNVMMENWPLVKRVTWNIYQSRGAFKNYTLFVDRVTRMLIRQHCGLTLYGGVGTAGKTLGEARYGMHYPKKGTNRVACGCSE